MSALPAPTSNNGVSDIFTVTNPKDGSSCVVHSQGAHVVSWKGPAGDERLFTSPAAVFKDGKAIRGGVPVIYPQFSDHGTRATHGVARSRQWRRVAAAPEWGEASASFAFEIPSGDAAFPNHASTLLFTVAVSAEELRLHVRVIVAGGAPAETGENDEVTEDNSFAFAFHSYFGVSDIASVSLAGFDNLPYHNSLTDRTATVCPSSPDHDHIRAITGETDRNFYGIPPGHAFSIVDPGNGRRLIVFSPAPCTATKATELSSAAGGGAGGDSAYLPDAVLWNPWAEKNARLADLPQPDGYRGFVCIEHGAIKERVRFSDATAAKPWEGCQVVRCEPLAADGQQAKI